LLFARKQQKLSSLVGLALTPFDSFSLLQSKATFVKVLDDLKLPQPRTHLVRTRAELEAECKFPFYVKLPYSTAGQGVRRVTSPRELSAVTGDLEGEGVLEGQNDIVIQSVAHGVQCQAQAVYEHGTLVAVHCTSQRSVGMGGSQSARLSVDHPIVRSHLSLLGQRLGWHGALAVDYFLNPSTDQPLYYEANPRLVEPMNAVLSGVNLADILVRLSLGESLKDGGVKMGNPGVRSHSLLATLLGVAAYNGSRTCIAREFVTALFRRGVYSSSREDLTPIVVDPLSVLPMAAVLVQLLFSPSVAQHLSARTIADNSLTPEAVMQISGLGDDEA
jgi:predicted ATP-grasp superfamily ATP-dependent carboligase